MRYIVLAILLCSLNVYALEDCPGGKWTSQVRSSSKCKEFACFERKIVSQNGKICGVSKDTVYYGFFTVEIFDSDNVKQATEKFYLDESDGKVKRIEVRDSNNRFVYFIDGNGDQFYPNGDPMPEGVPNPAGKFYEEAIKLAE